MEDYRAYFFGNMYLSSIQQGIQAAHVVHEMFIKYPKPVVQRHNGEDHAGEHLWKWAENDKTMILLNAGFGAEIADLAMMFTGGEVKYENPYPWAVFLEEQATLNGAYTSIGIILPSRIWNTVSVIREHNLALTLLNSPQYSSHPYEDISALPNDFTDWEIQLLERLPKYSLAR